MVHAARVVRPVAGRRTFPNLATLSRYFGRDLSEAGPRETVNLPISASRILSHVRVLEMPKRWPQSMRTARYLGLGLHLSLIA
jgi:hypothetical protein